MSITQKLLYTTMSPLDVCVNIYEAVRQIQGEKALSTTGAEVDYHQDGAKISLSQDEYCGRGCHCYHGTTNDKLIIPDVLLEAYERKEELQCADDYDSEAVEYANSNYLLELNTFAAKKEAQRDGC